VRLSRAGYDEPIIVNFRPVEANDAIVNADIQSGDWLHVPSARRSQLRDDMQFIGNMLGLLLSAISLIVIVNQNTGG